MPIKAMKAMTKTTDKPTKDGEPKPLRLNILAAFLNLVFPGFGQLIQGRQVFMVYAILYLLSLFILNLVGNWYIDHWAMDGFFFFKIRAGAILFCMCFLAFPIMTISLSVLDAAVWKPGRPAPLGDWLIRLCIWTVACVILFPMLGPAVAYHRGWAERSRCEKNLTAIAHAMRQYHDEFKSFPPAYTVDVNGQPLHSWRVLILPYIEQKSLYDEIRLDEPWNSEHNRQFHGVSIEPFSCPSSVRDGVAHCTLTKKNISETCYYSVVIGEDTVFPGQATVSLQDIGDGTANTILVTERLMPVCWMDPNNEIRFESTLSGINRSLYVIGSGHHFGANAAFADGKVQFLRENIEPQTLRALLARSGGEQVVP